LQCTYYGMRVLYKVPKFMCNDEAAGARHMYTVIMGIQYVRLST